MVSTLVSSAVDIIISQLSSDRICDIPAILTNDANYNCSLCCEVSPAELVFFDGNGQLLLALRMCDQCSEQTKSIIHTTRIRLKNSIHLFIANSFVQYSLHTPECDVCDQMIANWTLINVGDSPICTSCLIASKWIKYRWIFMSLHSLCEDVRAMCVSLLMINDINFDHHAISEDDTNGWTKIKLREF